MTSPNITERVGNLTLAASQHLGVEVTSTRVYKDEVGARKFVVRVRAGESDLTLKQWNGCRGDEPSWAIALMRIYRDVANAAPRVISGLDGRDTFEVRGIDDPVYAYEHVPGQLFALQLARCDQRDRSATKATQFALRLGRAMGRIQAAQYATGNPDLVQHDDKHGIRLLSHDDLHCNAVADPTNVTFIDFDNARFRHPLRDARSAYSLAERMSRSCVGQMAPSVTFAFWREYLHELSLHPELFATVCESLQSYVETTHSVGSTYRTKPRGEREALRHVMTDATSPANVSSPFAL